jgi:hypothetical protein
MAAKYERERSLVDLLLSRRGIVAEGFSDPNQEGDESGADVIAVVGGRCIGVQVTELDTGDIRGRADASFFPSIGAVNPTLTIIANALRVADKIKLRLTA